MVLLPVAKRARKMIFLSGLADQLALVDSATLECIGGWFDKKCGAAYGITVTGGSVGGDIVPNAVSPLIDQVCLPWMLRICAFLPRPPRNRNLGFQGPGRPEGGDSQQRPAVSAL